MITLLLQFEADGADHSGIEIDRHLREAARDLGYPSRISQNCTLAATEVYLQTTATGRRQW